MQLEAKEPTHRAFSSLIYAFENLVNMYSLVFADTQWCAVNEAYTRTLNLVYQEGPVGKKHGYKLR